MSEIQFMSSTQLLFCFATDRLNCFIVLLSYSLNSSHALRTCSDSLCSLELHNAALFSGRTMTRKVGTVARRYQNRFE
jgi:hypothetical protein